MGILKTFVNFAESLNEEDRAEAERMVMKFMQDHANRYSLTAAQEADLKERLTDPNPQYATDAEVEAVLGRTFN